MDKVSYALGLNIGNNLLDAGIDKLEWDKFLKGVKDSMEKNDQEMTNQEAQQELNSFFAKLQAEAALRSIQGLDYVVVRPTGVYGPRERDYFMMAKSIKSHVDFAVGYRRQVITFIYVADLVEAIFLALEKGRCGKAYALTDGGEYASRAFSDLLQQHLGVKHVVHIKAPLWVLKTVWGVGYKFEILV